MNFTKEHDKFLQEKGFEYLPSLYCYAKPNDSISIMRAEKGEFYIHLTKTKYIRGEKYNQGGGTFIGYFKNLEDIFKITKALSGLKIGY